MRTTVPCDVSFAVDLQLIDAESVRWDPQQKVLRVTMPSPMIESVSPNLAKIEHASELGWARFRWWDGETVEALQKDNLGQIEHHVRERAMLQIESIRGAAKDQLRVFLQRIIQAQDSKAVVVVD